MLEHRETMLSTDTTPSTVVNEKSMRPLRSNRNGNMCTRIADFSMVVIITAGIGAFTNDKLVGVGPFFAISEGIWKASLFAIPLAAATLRHRIFFIAVRQTWLVFVLPFLAVVSIVWSYQPDDTVTAAGLLALATLWATAVVVLAQDRFWEILLVAIASISALSLIYSVFDVAAVDTIANGMRGILPQKNSLGRIAAAGVIVALLDRKLTKVKRVGLAIAPILALVLSASSTALLATVLPLVLVWLIGLKKRNSLWYYGVNCIATLFAAALILLGAWRSIFEPLGKDVSLSGRTNIWSDVWPYVQENLALGYGYGAFWPWYLGNAFGDPTSDRATNAHSFFLETALGLGMVGVIAAAAIIISLVKNLSKHTLPAHEHAIVATLIAFVVIESITESSTMEPRTLGLLLIVKFFLPGGLR